jgi:hypothetical protein
MRDKKSFKTAFPQYDYDLVQSLLNAYGQNEGSIFQWSDSDSSLEEDKKHILFHEKIFKTLKPKAILEIGTHKANYSYIAKVNLPDVKVWTFGLEPESQICVDILNEHFNEKYITFIQGDSKVNLPKVVLKNVSFDMAWVDGGHDNYTAISDLNECKRLNIKNILVDDCFITGVQKMVNIFVENSEYSIKEVSDCVRKVVFLTRP